MSQQQMPIVSIVFEDEDVPSLAINQYFATLTTALPDGLGNEIVKVLDAESVQQIDFGVITAAQSKSLHILGTATNFQTSKAARVILIVFGSGTTVTDFEIIESSAADSGAGVTKQDFPVTSLTTDNAITSKVLSFATTKYVTVKCNVGTIIKVIGWVIE